MKPPPCFEDTETKRIIREICDRHQIDMELLKDLCELVNERSGSGRRFGLDDEMAGILSRFLTRTKES